MSNFRQSLLGRMGEVYIVEIDEVAFSQKAKHGMGSSRRPVFYLTMIERHTGEAILIKLPRNRKDRDTILGLAHKYLAGMSKCTTTQTPFTALLIGCTIEM